jgi:broad specificity phosphatase PhoE
MRTIHLVRHGEVANPNHVVYADLPGFNLSPTGVRQAHATGIHLSTHRVDAVITSPLARAVQTAVAIARHHRLDPVVSPGLTETGQYPHWTGQRWDELQRLFPGQLERYLVDASALGDASETIEAIAQRIIDVVVSVAVGDLVVVGHQDPLQAARLELTGRPLGHLLVDPPSHGSVVTLDCEDDGTWHERSYWQPRLTAPDPTPTVGTGRMP